MKIIDNILANGDYHQLMFKYENNKFFVFNAACKLGLNNVVEQLIKDGLDLNHDYHKTGYGYVGCGNWGLYLAFIDFKYDTVKYLLKHHFDFDVSHMLYWAKRRKEWYLYFLIIKKEIINVFKWRKK